VYDGSTTLKRLQRLNHLMDMALALPVPKLYEAIAREAVMPNTMRTVPIDLVRLGTSLRRQFPENEIDELGASIREKGIIQPVLVRRSGDRFELIAGERRWRAAQRAGLHEVPVIVLPEVTDHEAIEIALVENLQRENLSPIEEAEAYRRLIEMCGCSQQDIAEIIGKAESYVSHSMRLLKLPEPVQHQIEAGELSARHGRLLVAAPNPTALAAEVVRRGLNTLQTEALVQKHAATRRRTSRTRGTAAVLGTGGRESLQRIEAQANDMPKARTAVYEFAREAVDLMDPRMGQADRDVCRVRIRISMSHGKEL
jgi:ParB family chromosome partitioning protein